MSELILHHYDASPFSEKIRLMMGYKSAAQSDFRYRGVDIPVIMPKPTLMPLTGGYRKTPVAQVGADIYCDSALISRLIDRMYPENPLFPPELEATTGAMAHWTDTFFFRVSVAMAFQPKALASSPLFSDPKTAAAFMADRAEFGKGSTELQMDFSAAEPHWLLHLRRLDEQLGHQDFLFGSAPNIADFSTYHCLWFVHNNAALQPEFKPFQNVVGWMQRMAAFGHGDFVAMDGAEALAVAKAATPQTPEKQGFAMTDGPSVGDQVDVLPIDYGFQPTTGELLMHSLEEIAVKRKDDQVGEVVVHFPRLGFRIQPSQALSNKALSSQDLSSQDL